MNLPRAKGNIPCPRAAVEPLSVIHHASALYLKIVYMYTYCVHNNNIVGKFSTLDAFTQKCKHYASLLHNILTFLSLLVFIKISSYLNSSQSLNLTDKF